MGHRTDSNEPEENATDASHAQEQFCNQLSAKGREWAVRPRLPGPVPSVTLRNGAKVPDAVVDIVSRRGIKDLSAYFEPTLRALMPNPYTMTAMKEAVEAFTGAVVNGRQIALFGDYDVDGATSTSIVALYLRMLGIDNTLCHIPDRLKEGYGPNIPAITKLKEAGAELLLIEDSGTTAFEQIEHATSIGLEVIVLDHHEPGDTLPSAIVVNPKRAEDDGSLSYLCTAGLATLFIVGVNRSLRETGFFTDKGLTEPNISDLLGITALGTVADVVPLEGLNRAYVKLGLPKLGLNIGLKALMEQTGDVECTSRSCGFVLGPCINAGGRISDTTLGFQLMTETDPDKATATAARLVELNQERREMQTSMVEKCIESAQTHKGGQEPAIVVYDPNWHPGVVGLGASKVKDHFEKTCVASVVIGAEGKGSGRAAEGFNVGKAFHKAVELGLLLKGGGHAAAGGLTIDPAKVDAFRDFLNEEAKDVVRPPVTVDIAVPVGKLSVQEVEKFELMAPFGQGNPAPVIAMTGGVLSSVRVLKDKHIKGRVSGNSGYIDIIAFNIVGTTLGDTILNARGHYVDLMGKVELNTYGGNTRLQMKPTDIMIGNPAYQSEASTEAA